MAASLYEVGLASPRCPPKPSPRCKKSVWPVGVADGFELYTLLFWYNFLRVIVVLFNLLYVIVAYISVIQVSHTYQ
jgi:hypothetical protein